MLNSLSILPHRLQLRRGLLFGLLIVTALLAFEVFNYSTTDFALTDLLGDLTFVSIRWATILSIAFCGIDFAGIARLFTPEQGADEPAEVWYLFGAWMLAATMNAMLTWWGVSIAILNHTTLGNAVVARATLLKVVPIFVAVMVWLIRVLIIGTISVAGDRLFSQTDVQTHKKQPRSRAKTTSPRPTRPGRSIGGIRPSPLRSKGASDSPYRPAPKPEPQTNPNYGNREPTYHPVSMRSGRSENKSRQTRF